ncbi:MAG: hypothetical protein ACYCW6_12610 [Candidatus Xenobia bacterium]
MADDDYAIQSLDNGRSRENIQPQLGEDGQVNASRSVDGAWQRDEDLGKELSEARDMFNAMQASTDRNGLLRGLPALARGGSVLVHEALILAERAGVPEGMGRMWSQRMPSGTERGLAPRLERYFNLPEGSLPRPANGRVELPREVVAGPASGWVRSATISARRRGSAT